MHLNLAGNLINDKGATELGFGFSKLLKLWFSIDFMELLMNFDSFFTIKIILTSLME